MAGISDLINKIKGLLSKDRKPDPSVMEGGDDPEYMKRFNFLWEQGFSERQIQAIMSGEVNQTDIVPERMQMDENMNFSIPQEPFTGAKGGIAGYEDGGFIRNIWNKLFSKGDKKEGTISTIKRKRFEFLDARVRSGLELSPEEQLEYNQLKKMFKRNGGTVDLLESLMPRMAGGGIKDLRQAGGMSLGPGTEKSDSIPAMLSDGEFVMTSRAVRGLGDGSRKLGAKRLYDMMHKAERNATV